MAIISKEIVLFLGNPGSGKSSLCNCIFQRVQFHSGLGRGTGLTEQKQEHFHEGKLYVDTPGLADPLKKEEAAKEIEDSLKKHYNYKIVFVVRLMSGRLMDQDLATINCVCKAIKTQFDYGIVINQIRKKELENLGKEREAFDACLSTLFKQPYGITHVEEVADMRDEDNCLLEDEKTRKNLIDFIDNLKANNIPKETVKTIEVRDFKRQVSEIQENISKALAQKKTVKRNTLSAYQATITSVLHSSPQTESFQETKFVATQYVEKDFVVRSYVQQPYSPTENPLKSVTIESNGILQNAIVKGVDEKGNTYKSVSCYYSQDAKAEVEEKYQAAETSRLKLEEEIHKVHEAERATQVAEENFQNLKQHVKEQNELREQHQQQQIRAREEHTSKQHVEKIAFNKQQIVNGVKYGALAGTIASGSVSVLRNVSSCYKEEISPVEAARNVGLDVIKGAGIGAVTSAVTTSFNVLTSSTYGGTVLQASLLAGEISIQIRKWYFGEITSDECAKAISRDFAVKVAGIATSLWVGVLTSYALSLCPSSSALMLSLPIATAAIGSSLGSALMSHLIKELKDKYFKSPTQTLKDAYDFLGVQSDATNKEINNNYRALAMVYHPDKAKGNEEKMVKLNIYMEIIRAART